MVTKEIFSAYGRARWTLPEFQRVLAKAIEQIPPGYRERATVAIDEEGKLEIYYVRPETK